MNKKHLIIFSPLASLLLLPFNIPLSVFYHTLAPYGSLNPYLIGSALGLSALLWINDKIVHGGNPKLIHIFFVGVLLLASFIFRLLLFPFESDDYEGALSKWFFYIQENGGFSALQYRNFSDYNSVYLYIIALLTYLPIKPLVSIKLVSVCFDYFGAFWMYKTVRLAHSKQRAVIAALLLLFLPTVVVNSSLWAQCDMTYTSFLLMATYFIVKAEKTAETKPFLYAILAFSFAFLFKLQSVFFVLVFLWLYVSKRVPLSYFLLIPIVWLIFLLPHWLLGRDFFDLLLIYPRQVFKAQELLTFNAPTVYTLLPNAPYSLFKSAGIFFSVCLVVAMGWYFWQYGKRLAQHQIIRLAAFSLVLIPFFLPRMHERYFFPADVFLLLLALYTGKKYWLPLLMVGVSLMSYVPFLFKTAPPIPFAFLSLGVAYIAWHLWTDFRQETLR